MTAPRTDGVYRSLSAQGMATWMRFYPTGPVLATSTSAAPAAQIACWLRVGASKHISQGTWAVEGEVVRAALTCSYKGIAGRTMTLDSRRIITVSTDGASLTDRWVNESTDPRVSHREGESAYRFVPVAARYLDGDGQARDFRCARSVASLAKHGFDPAQLQRVKAMETVTLAMLNALEADELLAAGLEGDFVEALVRWRSRQ